MPRLFLVSPLPAVRAGLRALLGGAGELDVAGGMPAPGAPARVRAARPNAGIIAAPAGVDAHALALHNKPIARRLGISEHTAKFHVAAVMSKLGAASRTEAVRLGARRGLVAL